MRQEIAAVGGIRNELHFAGVEPLVTQRDLPEGLTVRCLHCGARIREGEPHIAIEPYPHGTMAMLTKREKICPGI